MEQEKTKPPESKPLVAARVRGNLRTFKSIEEAISAVEDKSKVTEIFELKSLGHYRRKVEVEKVEVLKFAEEPAESHDDDEGYD